MTINDVDLASLLAALHNATDQVLNQAPVVDEAGDDFTADEIPSAAAHKWVKFKDVVVVVCDLKSSTQLGIRKHGTSTARIFRSGVEGAVKILHDFDADYIDIQGDGGFGVFWGQQRYERAICAAVTIRKFSESWEDDLVTKWPEDLPETGYKVGIAAGRVLAKRLGTKNVLDETEVVWAGKPVNYAVKCAQAADSGQLIATNKVWERLSSNDFVAYSCGCSGGGPARLWDDIEVPTLPDGADECVVLTSTWCDNCGPTFCNEILSGGKNRSDVGEARRETEMAGMRAALAIKARRDANARYPK